MMNNIMTVILVSLVLVVFLIKQITGELIKQLPKRVLILLLVAVIIVVIWLVYTYASGVGGNPESNDSLQNENTDTFMNNYQEEASTESVKNCIVLRNDDEIWIDDKKVDRDTMIEYIEDCAGKSKEILIIDDYSAAIFHHQITTLCDDKGVNYTEEDEKGNEL